MYKTKSVIFLILLSLCTTLKAEELSKRFNYNLTYMVTRFYSIDPDDISSVKLIKGGKLESNITDAKQIDGIYLFDPTYENDAEGNPEYLPNSYTYILTYRENGDTEGKEMSEGINNGYIYVNVEEAEKWNGSIPCKKITLMYPPTTFERMAENSNCRDTRSFSFVIPVFEFDDDSVMERITQLKMMLNEKDDDGKSLIDKEVREELLKMDNSLFDDLATALFLGDSFPYLPMTSFENYIGFCDDALFAGNVKLDDVSVLLREFLPNYIDARSHFNLSSAYYTALYKILSRNEEETNACNIIYSMNLWQVNNIEAIIDADENYKKVIGSDKKFTDVEGTNWAAYYVLLKWRICFNRKEFDEAKKVLETAKAKFSAKETSVFDQFLQQTIEEESKYKKEK